MFIAVDDTDSRNGRCTTYLMTEIIRELDDWDLIGHPALVRLNPAVPWKTRGNASLAIRIGRGTGEGRTIGRIAGKDIACYPSSAGEPDQREIMERLVPVLLDNREGDSDSGLIVSLERPDPSLYWKGVRTILSKADAETELEKVHASVFTAGNGRGVIGAACGMSWVPGDFTFELSTYRERGLWGTERYVDPMSIRDMDAAFPKTFNSWEERWNKVAMVPSTPCPVLYGLRGDDDAELMEAMAAIRSEEPERWIVFKSNQGTDDHIIRNPEELVPDRSYSMEGTVSGTAVRMRGGHVFIPMETAFGTVTLGAYEPSKEFRMLFDHLVPGDRLEAMGELRDSPRTLNVEKINVIGLNDDVTVSNPRCPVCGRSMKSAGRGQGYRCKACRTRSDTPVIGKRVRWVVLGWYEPPVAARRHLSKPLKRMGVEQPLDFVNSRMV